MRGRPYGLMVEALITREATKRKEGHLEKIYFLLILIIIGYNRIRFLTYQCNYARHDSL